MPYTIPSSLISPGAVYQPRQIPAVITQNARALYYTRGGSTSGSLLLDQSPLNSGTRRTGEDGRCYLYDGVDDYSNLNSTVTISGDLSLSFWAKRTDINSFNFIFNDGNLGSPKVGFNTSSDGLFIRISDSSSWIVDSGVDTTLWNHYVVVRESGVTKAYVNGTDLGSSSAAAGANDFVFSSIASVISQRYKGEFFDLRVYNKALTQSEVDFVKSFGQTGTDPDLPLHWWKCDEQSGTVGYDSVGGNNLTHTNITAGTFHATQDIWSFQNQVGYGNFYLGDGATGYLTVNQSAFTPLDGENWTVAYRCSDLLNTAGSTPFSAGNTGNNTYFGIYHYASSNQLQIFAKWDSTNVTNDLFILPNGSINNNSQHDIIVRKSGTDLRLYVDGVLEKTITLSENETMSTNNKPFTLLALNRASVTSWFASPLYNLRAWDVAVDLSEISNITSGSTPTSGLWGHWVLNSLSDLSGNGYDLEINGTVYQLKNPRDESDPTNDVLGNPLTYTGRRPNDAKLNGSNCLTADGTLYIAAAHLAGTETVVSSGGTSTPSISAGRIDFTAGTCWDLTLSDGTHYKLAEGYGVSILDASGNGNHGTLTSATLASAWGATQDDYHSNLIDGSGKRIYFDGVDDNVTLGIGDPLGFNGASKVGIKFKIIPVKSPSATEFIFVHFINNSSFGGIAVSYNNNFQINFGGRSVSSDSYQSATSVNTINPLLLNTVEVYFDYQNDEIGVKINNNDFETFSVSYSSLTYTNSNTTINTFIGSALSAYGKGVFFDFEFYKNDILINSYEGRGNTNADWADKTGTVNGTVNGSPEAFYIPAAPNGLDVFGNELTEKPSDATRNRAETLIDLNPDSTPEMGATQLGITVPASHAFGDAFAASTQIFSRQRTLTEDRFVVMPEAQSGSALATIQKYTQP